MSSIPIVDFKHCGIYHNTLKATDLQSVGNGIYQAFIDVGFVYLTNTGIDSSSVETLNAVTEAFFLLPDVIKAQYFRKVYNFGYDAIGKERLVSGYPGDYKESFNITGGAINNPDVKWPDDVVPGFSKITSSFMADCKTLALRILDALSYGLKLEDPTYLSSLHSSILQTNNGSSLRCLRYPPVLHQLNEGQVRLAEHTDYGSMTLLFQDLVGGLQIKTRDERYIEAVPIKDAVLVNIADLLQYWTNGILRSTPHRILVPDERNQRDTVRRSVAFFVHPSQDLLVSNTLFKECFSGNNTKLHGVKPEELERLTVGEYLQSQFNATYT